MTSTMLLHVTELLIVLFALAGFTMILGAASGNESWWRNAAWVVSLLGPSILGIYWNVQHEIRLENTLFWSRLMGGDAGNLIAIASLGILVGSGLALGALSLGNRLWQLLLGAVAVSLSWIVIYLHPTPHYVPVSEQVDNMIWFAILVGGSVLSILVYLKLQPWLKCLQKPAAIASGGFAMLSLVLLLGQGQAQSDMDLASLTAEQRIKELGCLACHTMDGVGQEHPGDGLESIASRTEDVLLAFMKDPTAETAKKLGIREQPTGEMGGVHLSDEDAQLVVDALNELFEIKPPTVFGPGNEAVEAIIVQNNCLACHTIKGEGAPGGGLGGPFENASKFEFDVLVEYLQEPTEAKAAELKIREVPMGAMVDFPLQLEDAKIVATWLKTLKPVE